MLPAELLVGLHQPLLHLLGGPLLLDLGQQLDGAAPVLEREAVPHAVVDRLGHETILLS